MKNLISGPIQKMGNIIIVGLIFAHLVEILARNFFFVSFTSTSSKTLFQAIILCNLKEN